MSRDSLSSNNNPLLCVTMAPEAAERFKAALRYASAVCDEQADSARMPATVEKLRGHAEWLRWGHGRIDSAEVDDT